MLAGTPPLEVRQFTIASVPLTPSCRYEVLRTGSAVGQNNWC